MAEVIRFVPKSERERARLTREARAIYDSIFLSADPMGARRDAAQRGDVGGSSSANHCDGIRLP